MNCRACLPVAFMVKKVDMVVIARRINIKLGSAIIGGLPVLRELVKGKAPAVYNGESEGVATRDAVRSRTIANCHMWRNTLFGGATLCLVARDTLLPGHLRRQSPK